MRPQIPSIRIQSYNEKNIRPHKNYVLFWMISSRRLHFNFALQHAVDWCNHLGLPLILLESLTYRFPYATHRTHHFVLEGMLEHVQELQGHASVLYCPYVERSRDTSYTMDFFAQESALIITDNTPTKEFQYMYTQAAQRTDIRIDCVDTNGLLPLASTERIFTTARSFRTHLQKEWSQSFPIFPDKDPIQKMNPKTTQISRELLSSIQQWPIEDGRTLQQELTVHRNDALSLQGGRGPAQKQLERFITDIDLYGQRPKNIEEQHTSQLSAYIHFGHISSHEIFEYITQQYNWNPKQLRTPNGGRRVGWWNLSDAADIFMDELIIWRELGFNMCSKCIDYDRYTSLPHWARTTLEEHWDDPRAYVYSIDEFEYSQTHDPLWNAAQTQLRTEGKINGYLRMLWGKKILEWSASPHKALEYMLTLNNTYALDGRDPNSYSGIFWVLGRYDRAWGPERPILGKVRYMSSESTQRKFKVHNYIKKHR